MDQKTSPESRAPPAYPMNNVQPQMQPQVIPASGPAMHFQNAIPINQLSDRPAPVDCPACHQRALTITQFKSGNTTKAWILGTFLVACGTWITLPLIWVPLCCKSTKDVVHRCSQCKTKLVRFHRSGRVQEKPILGLERRSIGDEPPLSTANDLRPSTNSTNTTQDRGEDQRPLPRYI